MICKDGPDYYATRNILKTTEINRIHQTYVTGQTIHVHEHETCSHAHYPIGRPIDWLALYLKVGSGID